MELNSKQIVFAVTPPEYFGFQAKEAFTILKGTYLKPTTQDYHLVKVELETNQDIKETLVMVHKDKLFISMKDAIDYAYNTYSKSSKEENT